MKQALPCAYTEALLAPEPRPHLPLARRQLVHPEPPLPSGPTPASDLSRAPSEGARRPHDPARTRGVAKPRRGGRGRGRRTPGHPRSGAAEAAAGPPGSGAGPVGQPEPTTSRLPWFPLRPPLTAPPSRAARRLKNTSLRHDGLPIGFASATQGWPPLSIGPNGGDSSSVICAGTARPTLLLLPDYESQRSLRS